LCGLLLLHVLLLLLLLRLLSLFLCCEFKQQLL
jgi:hypothetical protein